ncbi:MAG: PilN domain-containing protein [Patescibacteria group bacterium]
MALPSKVVDQLSRAPARTPGWSSRVLLFSATFFILSLAIFLGIQYGYGPFLENQMTRIDREIDEFSKQVPQRQQDELISFYSQLENLSTLLNRQMMTSKIFSWLEENTNVSVQLNSLAFNGGNRTLTLTGQARSINNLGEQLNRFRSQPVVKNSQLSQLALDQKNNSWNFSVVLTMTPEFFASSLMGLDAVVEDDGSLGGIPEAPLTAGSSTTPSATSTSSSTTTQ